MVTKNLKKIVLPQIDELEGNDNLSQVGKGAALVEKTKGRGGRAKKSDEEKATEYIPVYVTKDQKATLTKNAKGASLSSLIKALLVEKGYL